MNSLTIISDISPVGIGLGCIAVLGVMVLVAIAIVWSGYNRLVRLSELVNNGFSDINVFCKRRYDLIPNLIAVAKQYMSHESGTLEAVIQARNQAQGALQGAAVKPSDAGAVQAFVGAEQTLTGSLGRMFALAEAYPDLKANTNMLKIQDELSNTEDGIARARESYNNQVTNFNIHRKSVPTVMYASMVGFGSDRELLEFDDQDQIEHAPDVGALFDS
ncbi:MAG: LemA family protein [Pirellulales bacterium]|jgi:LemA protein|tara:strand:+ start:138 stop:791 length:654 start_codon:yes stop_codon:yes gene_type:complete